MRGAFYADAVKVEAAGATLARVKACAHLTLMDFPLTRLKERKAKNIKI